MSLLTITVVTPATDQLTIPAHGLNTGDGPVAVYGASAGAVIPGGLAAVTDYWVIKVDANNIKLATSSANALANTAIDITSTGSGTLQLAIGLPFRRQHSYVAGVSQVYSGDLNAIQDDLIALWNWFTGQTQTLWPSTMARYTTALARTLHLSDAYDTTTVATTPAVNGPQLQTHSFASGVGQLLFAASATPVYIPIRGLTEGDVITELDIDLEKNTNNTGTFTADIVYSSGTSSYIASGSAYTNNNNAPGLVAFNGNFNITVVAGRQYFVKLTPTGIVAPAADRVDSVRVKWTHP